MPHEENLLRRATEQLNSIPGLRIIGTAAKKAGVLSFVVDDPVISPLDLGMKLDQRGIAVRTGHHCCQPIMDRLRISATTRASFAMYNTIEEVDMLAAALKEIIAEASGSSAASSQDSVQYPSAAADSPAAAADALAEDFEFLAERDARNEYVLELGEKLPHTFELLKRVTQRVPGCMSEVYIVARHSPGDRGKLEFVADANADIVRGLIAILERLYSGQRAEDVLDFDIEGFFRRIGLDQFISSQRRNGLAGMIQRIRASAKALLQESTAHDTAPQ